MKNTSIAVLIGLAFAATIPAITHAETKASASTPAKKMSAPIAAKKPYVVKAPHGAERQDEYYWLRDDKRENKEMLDYLKAENAYADAHMQPLRATQDKIYNEIVSRIKQDDASVPARQRGYWYYSRFEQGKDYPIFARRAGTMQAAEEILLNVNELAAGKDFYQVGSYVISQNNELIAYAEDTNGRRQYTIRFKNLKTGEVLKDEIKNVEAGLVWDNDNKTVYYIDKDPVTLLSKRVKAHVLGTDSKSDKLIYEEKDDSFYMGISRTRSDKFLCIGVQSTVSSEMRCMDFAKPGEFQVFAPRERDFEYSADHLGDRWVISTNWNARNYRLMTAKTDEFGDRNQWKEMVAHREDVFIEGFELFDSFMAVEERAEALTRIRILHSDGRDELVKADEPAYAMGLGNNTEANTTLLRYGYTSMTTPGTTYEVDVNTGKRDLLKRDPVLGDFDPANYVTERVWAPARDGTKIPVSIVYRKGFKKDGKAAMLQYAYGSYGASMDAGFSVARLSLLDRGVVYALAHIRGGQEMGRQWYDDGKLFNKKNTFTDFIDVTRYLVKEGYADKKRVAAMGGSAGGLLMGAISNMAPQDYNTIISQVPFVDVVTTMLDASIPLTTNEYDEWGNPEDKKYYDYMLSYSPYDNIEKKAYPAMFVGTGLWDSQVQYFEPAKYVARLRAHKTDKEPLVFRTNMEAGHGGKSGRFQRFKETAEQYAFMLDQLGVK
jgi:oligopeptidase B